MLNEPFINRENEKNNPITAIRCLGNGNDGAEGKCHAERERYGTGLYDQRGAEV
jgi:hypothetical protein